MRPIIGITGNHMFATDPKYSTFKVNYSPLGYTDAVTQAGGTPIVIPLGNVENVHHYVELIDGLILTGGEDVLPSYYGEIASDKLGKTSSERDEYELALLKAVLAANKPVLSICRGMQLVNVALGGSLYQDIESMLSTTLKHDQAESPEIATHPIEVKEGAYVAQFIPSHCSVNSIHHQSVKRLGKGLVATAWSHDGVVEAIESIDNIQIVGVQWHPEELARHSKENLAIFADLVKRSQQK